jgi:hypothetical protein
MLATQPPPGTGAHAAPALLGLLTPTGLPARHVEAPAASSYSVTCRLGGDDRVA